jgi:histone demethylase JARID1
MSSLSTSLKNSYQKWLHPYEEYLRVVKPGVHQLLELENGGPFTPSPAPSPMKKSAQATPAAHAVDSPAVKASSALNASLQGEATATPPPEASRPPMSSGFTAVNAGFTAINAQPQPPPLGAATSSSFSAVNAPGALYRDGADSRASTPNRNGGSPMLSAHNTPDLRPAGAPLAPLGSAQSMNQLKRTLSQDTEGNMTSGESELANSRRSKRARKGK